MKDFPAVALSVGGVVNVHGFFSGIGGFELGFEREGYEVRSVCEIDLFCNQVLKKHWPNVPNLGDIRSLSAASRAKTYRSQEKREALTLIAADCGSTISKSLRRNYLTGSSPKTSDTLGVGGCPVCGMPLDDLDIPACHYECEPVTWERTTKGRESTLLPTPTASSYGSCRGGGSGRVGKWRKSLLSLGIRDPDDWEAMMGFPRQWTVVDQLEIQSVRKSRKSSHAG